MTMVIDEERFRRLEEKINKLMDHQDDISLIRKVLKFIKKNKKYFRFSIDILLLISTILGFLI